jgi:hypothetical protein
MIDSTMLALTVKVRRVASEVHVAMNRVDALDFADNEVLRLFR